MWLCRRTWCARRPNGIRWSEALAEGGKYIFRMEINGSMGMEEAVTLKYYSTRNSYLYQATAAFMFAGGSSYGTAAEPSIPAFINVE